VSVDDSGRGDESACEIHREKRWGGRLCERNREKRGEKREGEHRIEWSKKTRVNERSTQRKGGTERLLKKGEGEQNMREGGRKDREEGRGGKKGQCIW